jgi:hypothetical protein
MKIPPFEAWLLAPAALLQEGCGNARKPFYNGFKVAG